MDQQQLEIVFSPSETQQTFLNAVFSGKYKYLMFGGAVGGGKTYCALGALLLLCKVYPGSRHVVVRDSLQNLKLTTIPSFLKLCPERFLQKFNQDTMTATMTNGSQIIFFGEQFDSDKELLRWHGLECNSFVFEECGELQEASFYKAIERAGRWIPPTGVQPPPLILMTCNPSRNWVKTLWYDRYTASTLPHDWFYVPSKITDNPYVSSNAEYMDSLKNLPAYEYQSMVEGDWEIMAKTGDMAYKNFDMDNHLGDYEYDPNEILFLSVDENVSPYLTCIAFQLKKTETGFEVRMIAEVLASDPLNTVEGLTDMILKRFPPDKHKSTVELFGDATSRKQDTKLEKGSNFYSLVMGYLKAYKISERVPKSNEGVAMRLSWINAILEKEVSNIRFRIDKRCKNAISDFMLTKQAEDGSKMKTMVTNPKTKQRYQAVAHITDATDYFLCGKFSSAFSKYKQPGSNGRIISGKNPSPNNDWTGALQSRRSERYHY
jgi:hypothetical protein